MPRRRSKDPTTSIRITLPQSVLTRLHEDLTPTASRSAWIAAACRDKLLGSSAIEDASSMKLASVLWQRGAITRTMYDLVADHIKITERRTITSSNPSEEL